MANLAAEKLAVAQEAARLGVSFTQPNEHVLTSHQLGMLLDAISDPETVDLDELNRVIDEIMARWRSSCVVYQFPKPETE
jgi:hypothetical protein